MKQREKEVSAGQRAVAAEDDGSSKRIHPHAGQMTVHDPLRGLMVFPSSVLAVRSDPVCNND
ncbi:MAG TPA: hypothetical protein VL122_02720 [Nitrospirota bacterium]|nr:hypothetical protein [Nitrospirota bacterium]